MLTPVDLWTHDRWRFPLPERHRFPITKYGLLRARVVELGIATPEEIHEPDPVPWGMLERVHDERALGEAGRPELKQRADHVVEEAVAAREGAARVMGAAAEVHRHPVLERVIGGGERARDGTAAALDELVLDRLRATGAAVCVVLAGGYAEDVRDTVDINAATAAVVAQRLGATL